MVFRPSRRHLAERRRSQPPAFSRSPDHRQAVMPGWQVLMREKPQTGGRTRHEYRPQWSRTPAFMFMWAAVR